MEIHCQFCGRFYCMSHRFPTMLLIWEVNENSKIENWLNVHITWINNIKRFFIYIALHLKEYSLKKIGGGGHLMGRMTMKKNPRKIWNDINPLVIIHLQIDGRYEDWFPKKKNEKIIASEGIAGDFFFLGGGGMVGNCRHRL